MTVSLRPATRDDCAALTALAHRSKAHWGYDQTFMENCRDELAVTPTLINEHLIIAQIDGVVAGFACVGWVEDKADLDAMYVDPSCIGSGIGRVLFDWCVTHARGMKAKEMLIDADPHAEGFYQRLGAKRIGVSPSGSIPGRMLPQLIYTL